MADIKKTLSQLMTDYADNNVGNITPQLLRNGFKTAVGSMAVSAVNSNYTLVEDDIFVNAIPTTADVNILIPSPSNFIEKYYIIKNSGTSYNVIVSGSVDGSTNYTLTPGNTLGIEANGSTWLSYIKPFDTSSYVHNSTLSGSGTSASPLGVTVSLSAGIQNVNVTSANEGNILAYNNGSWVARGNFYNWDDTAAIVYANRSLWDSISAAPSTYVNTSGDTMTGPLRSPLVSAAIIEFNMASTENVSAGQVRWNSAENTYDFAVSGATGQLFEEFWIGAHNETGSPILNGQAVYLTSGSNDGELHVALASNNSINATATIAIATHDVANGERGKFTKYGRVRDFNTSALTANAKVYLGVNGGLTSTQPTYPLHSVEIGYCTISHATSGTIYVSIENNLAIEDLYNTTIINPQVGDSLIYENNKWINRNFGAITKESTGFASPELVTVNYNKSARTITLSGSVSAYWRSNVIPTLSAGWTSAPHSSGVSATQYLYYDGSNFVWSNGVEWTFDMLQIAAVVYDAYGVYQFTLREPHGTMQWQVHRELHSQVGTWLQAGGDLSNYTPASSTVSARRPDISSVTLSDEDLDTTLSALTNKTYTQFSLSGTTGRAVFTSGAADMLATGAGQLPYNQFTGGSWTQGIMSNNDYAAIFVMAIPVATLDAKSNAKRYLFIQPQTSNGSLTTIQALTPNNLSLGQFSSPEYNFFAKIIVRSSTSNNWTIISVEKLTGSKFSQTSTAAGYLSTVSTDTSLSGAGTPSNPLGINMLDTLPAGWVATSTTVSANSANWNTAYTSVSAVSAYDVIVGSNAEFIAALQNPAIASIYLKGTSIVLSSNVNTSGAKRLYGESFGLSAMTLSINGGTFRDRTNKIDITGTVVISGASDFYTRKLNGSSGTTSYSGAGTGYYEYTNGTVNGFTKAFWDNSNTNVGTVGSYSTSQSAYLVSAIAVVSAMPTSADRVANTLYFLLS
jgi:hypothetical protein